jgi:uncharacterized membrane protein
MQNRKMVIDNRRVMVGILTITLLLFPVVAFTTGTLRIILALPLALFFPGYTLLSALFPRREDLDSFRRMVFSVGLSIVVLPIIGLVLNYTPWGIGPFPILVSIFLFILVTSSTAWYRQRGLPGQERLSFTFEIRLSGWKDMSGLTRTLAIIILVAVLTTIGSLGYAISTPEQGDRYTEFYIMAPEYNTVEYAFETTVGQPVYLTVVITNHEHEPLDYRVEIVSGDNSIRSLSTGTLDHEEEWRREVDFVLSAPGENRKVEFYLYTDNSSEPYFEEPLHIFIDVR